MLLFGSHLLLRIRNLKFMDCSEHSHDILCLFLVGMHTPSQKNSQRDGWGRKQGSR